MISVCFITKNEERYLKDCIEHLKDLVQEFIVVDTGSTDQTVAIAQAAGAKVFEMEWPHDFSAARNFAISKATEPWILKIDPDERLTASHFDRIRELIESESSLAYQFWTRAYTNDSNRFEVQSFEICKGQYPEYEKNYRAYLTYPSIRLFKRLPFIQYSGRIHETIEPSLPGFQPGKSTIPSPDEEILFHHFGQNEDAHREKNKDALYTTLLEQEARANPLNWYILFELGNAAFENANLAKAIDCYRKADLAHPQKPQVLSNLGLALCQSGQVAEGERILLDLLRAAPKYSDAWLNLGVSRMEQNDFETALKAFDECLRIQPNSHSGLRARGRCLAQMNYRMNYISDALQNFEKAYTLVPFFHDAKVDAAFVFQALGQKDQVRTLCAEVLAEDKNHLRARELLASLS